MNITDKLLLWMHNKNNDWYEGKHDLEDVIADGICKDKKSISNTLYRLHMKGLIESCTTPGLWCLTDAGIEYADMLMQNCNSNESECEIIVDEDDIDDNEYIDDNEDNPVKNNLDIAKQFLKISESFVNMSNAFSKLATILR